ncbi:MAG TPA: SCO family protein [Rhizomicrobium sp.]|nr:SCO family protein [Rhizomicrobium sp.]
MLKTKEALIPYLLLAASVAGGLLWHESEMLPQLGHTIVSGQIAVGGPYALTDQDGKPRSSTDFRGKYQLIYFGYTFCPDVCPTTLAVMAAALEKMGVAQDRIVPVFITIDPARDKPSVLKKYLAAFGPRFVGLTGTREQIAEVERQYHVFARKQSLQNGNYSMDHSSVIYLMSPNGKLVSFYDGAASPDDLANDLKDKLERG